MENRAKFAGKKFNKVKATWKVPAFAENPPNGETWYAATFVGLDGGSPLPGFSTNLLQAGVAQKISTDAGGTKTACHAWYLWDPTGHLSNLDYSNYPVPGFPVSVGDTVTVELEYKDGKAVARFSSDKQPQRSVEFDVDAKLFKGDTMEWIMERPADPNTGKRQKLANVDAVDLENAVGSANGSPVAPNDGDFLMMEDDDSTHDLAEAKVGSSTVHIEFKDHE